MERPIMEPSQEQADPATLQLLQAQLSTALQELADSRDAAQAGRDREALLRNEFEHRVRNTLSIIRSVFSRTIDAGGSVEDIADHFHGRLSAIARYQTMQSHLPDGRTDFEQIIRDELQNFEFGYAPRIVVAGPPLRVPNDLAQMLALAVHELATNAIKFGALAPNNARGDLHAQWSATESVLHFTWVETGIPIVTTAPPRYGFGREFIEEALPYQVHARTRFDLRPGGVACEIMVPLDAATTGFPDDTSL